MNDKVTTVQCPTCGNKVAWGPQSPFRPFCSERCRLIDLGEWVEGTNRAIPGQELPVSDELGESPTDKNLEKN